MKGGFKAFLEKQNNKGGDIRNKVEKAQIYSRDGKWYQMENGEEYRVVKTVEQLQEAQKLLVEQKLQQEQLNKAFESIFDSISNENANSTLEILTDIFSPNNTGSSLSGENDFYCSCDEGDLYDLN